MCVCVCASRRTSHLVYGISGRRTKNFDVTRFLRTLIIKLWCKVPTKPPQCLQKEYQQCGLSKKSACIWLCSKNEVHTRSKQVMREKTRSFYTMRVFVWNNQNKAVTWSLVVCSSALRLNACNYVHKVHFHLEYFHMHGMAIMFLNLWPKGFHHATTRTHTATKRESFAQIYCILMIFDVLSLHRSKSFRQLLPLSTKRRFFQSAHSVLCCSVAMLLFSVAAHILPMKTWSLFQRYSSTIQSTGLVQASHNVDYFMFRMSQTRSLWREYSQQPICTRNELSSSHLI